MGTDLGGQISEGQEGSSMVSNHDSDPFNLGPIIEAISKGNKTRKRNFGSLEELEPGTIGFQR